MIRNDNEQEVAVNIPGPAADGVLSTAAATVDIASVLNVTPPSAGRSYTLPIPTLPAGLAASAFAMTLRVANPSALDFLCDGTIVPAGQYSEFLYTNGVWRWAFAKQGQPGGNIVVSRNNIAPATTVQFGGNFEFSCPASSDPRIRCLVGTDQAYISSEGLYPGGSFTTSTAAIVNLTTAFTQLDNNVHVAGEGWSIRFLSLTQNKMYVINAWRMSAITGNYTVWVEEIGVTGTIVLPPVISAATAVATTRTTTALAAEPALNLGLGPGTYHVESLLLYDSPGNADFQFSFTTTGAGSSQREFADNAILGASASTLATVEMRGVPWLNVSSANGLGTGAANVVFAKTEGILIMAATGNIRVNWSSGTAGLVTTLHAGSFIRATKVA